MQFGMVGVGANAPNTVNVIVEIPKGSTNKYEIEHDTGLVRLDRVLYSPLFYPCDYGFIPETLYSDGDPLDALVLLTHPTFPGCIVDAKPIGVLGMRDEKGRDDKIICVATRDPRFSDMEDLDDLSEHVRREIVHFFEVYKQLEEKSVEILGWDTKGEARRLIEEFRVAK
ncbi:MAG: inorganic diphosphatase [Armatimonadetes bacterium]|nr:inorganic diphosphatase [Armatimonadota bacterium]